MCNCMTGSGSPQIQNLECLQFYNSLIILSINIPQANALHDCKTPMQQCILLNSTKELSPTVTLAYLSEIVQPSNRKDLDEYQR